MAYVFTYTMAHSIAYIDKVNCLGWECEEVYCPDEYAVRVPGLGFLPCTKFDEYIQGNNEVLIETENENDHIKRKVGSSK